MEYQPAFPSVHKNNDGTTQHINGMTLRDYFAAKAMQSFIRTALPSQESIAKAAYDLADIMLKQREL